jgi:hypothetical protein
LNIINRFYWDTVSNTVNGGICPDFEQARDSDCISAAGAGVPERPGGVEPNGFPYGQQKPADSDYQVAGL